MAFFRKTGMIYEVSKSAYMNILTRTSHIHVACMMLLSIACFFIGPFVQRAEAHPLDITFTYLNVDSETQAISGTTNLHAFEVGMLLENNGIEYESISDAYLSGWLFIDYIMETIYVQNNGEACHFKTANVFEQDEITIMAEGFEIQYTMECAQDLDIVYFSNTMFTELELQTNQMYFVVDGNLEEPRYKKILTSKVTSDAFDFQDPERTLQYQNDADDDGLTDEEEEAYGTNPHLPDTDFDGYADLDEIEQGWYPLDPEAAVELMQGERVPLKEAQEKQQEYQEYQEQQEGVIFSSENIAGGGFIKNTNAFRTGKLKRYLGKISELFDEGSALSILFILLIAFVLGVLHSVTADHGKSILASYLIEQDKKMKDVLVFATSLTATHLLDVVVLGIAFKLFSLVSDIYKYINTIQTVGAFVLLGIAVFYLLRNMFPKKIKIGVKRKGPILGVIAGLAPCTIGWSVMIAIISLGKINWIVPIILVFGLGIFTTLVVFGFVVLKVKEKIINKRKNIARTASIISALLLLVVSIYLVLAALGIIVRSPIV